MRQNSGLQGQEWSLSLRPASLTREQSGCHRVAAPSNVASNINSRHSLYVAITRARFQLVIARISKANTTRPETV